MSVTNEIIRLQNAKASLKSSINAKTDLQHQIDDETIDEYADFVDTIQTGGGGISYPPDWSNLGYNNTPQNIIEDYNYSLNIKNNWNATETDITEKFRNDTTLKYMPLVDTSNVTAINGLFRSCSNLVKVPALTITSSVSRVEYLFTGCSSLIEVDVSNFNTSGVIRFTNMFSSCVKLTSLDLSNFNTSNATYLSSMFQGCSELKELNLSSFTHDQNSCSISLMFSGCTKLEKLDMRNFSFTTASVISNAFGNATSTNVPNNCLIIVKDNTEKSWFNTNFSRLTNVKTVAEYEAS